MNLIEWLEIELASYDVAILHISYKATRITSCNLFVFRIVTCNDNYLQIISYLAPYNCVQAKDYKESLIYILFSTGFIWISICYYYNITATITSTTRVDLGVMVMKGYSAFPKAPALPEPHYQIV